MDESNAFRRDATRPEWAEALIRICVMLASFSGFELILNATSWRVFPAFWVVFGAGAFWHSRWPSSQSGRTDA